MLRFIGSGIREEFICEKVKDAFKEHNIVIIQKVLLSKTFPAYNVYATTGRLEAGKIIEQ